MIKDRFYGPDEPFWGWRCPTCGNISDPVIESNRQENVKGRKTMKWPELPWPEDIWTMTDDDYVKAIPDPKLRTAISGYLMRKGWEVLKGQLKKMLAWQECKWLEVHKYPGGELEHECKSSENWPYDMCDNCPARD